MHIKDSLPYEARIIMITNVIISNIDYCNSVLICSPDNSLKPLQLVINKAVRFVFNLRKRTHITPYLKRLHILPIRYRINYKVCLISFRIINNTAPSYLIEKYPTFVPTTPLNLRIGSGRDSMMFAMEKHPRDRDTIDDKIKKTWNNLPLQLRQEKNLTSFKSKLKKHFFTMAFG